ncbi:MAG: class I SAM-dependent methyltransferase [Planctomycetes bacterium]|nr:class I SAM-dependent methyltransferase [Planctomycetota bacterium]
MANSRQLFIAVQRHLHALKHGYQAHPAIWSDFHLRARSWKVLLEACLGLGRPLTIVETGTACDNGSTWLFHLLTRSTGGVVHTIDINEDLCGFVSEVASKVGAGEEIVVHCGDSPSVLRTFRDPIDVLYLDSYDVDWTNPSGSMEHHLQELKAAWPLLARRSIVAFDDTPSGGAFAPWWCSPAERAAISQPDPPGKGPLAIKHLRQLPGRVTQLIHEYQAVFMVEK